MRKLLLVILMMICLVPLAQSKVYLVSVGVADYPGTKSDLRISDNDAKTIAKIYKATKDASIKVLVNDKATMSALLSSMKTLYANAQSDDAVILYFSGHGAPGALCCYDGQLDYTDIFMTMKSCKASNKIILVDACFSGKMRTNKQQANNYNTQNIMLFLSSRTNETSMESAYRNSLFTIYLERGLRGGADKNKDRRVGARELFDFVHEGVIKASGDEQHPVMWGKFDHNMTVIKW